MVEAAPPAPFIITKAELLFELLIIALDPPPQFCQVDQPIKGDILGQAGKPIPGRLGFVLRPLDQQPLFGARFGQQVVAVRHGTSPWVKAHGRTRSRANRAASQSALPSRHLTVCHLSCGRLRASAPGFEPGAGLAAIGRCWSSRRSNLGGRPLPRPRCGCKGSTPGGQTEVLGPIPAT